MVYRRSSLRYAHTTGHTSLIYTQDGVYIITCGSDGDIRKWRGIDDDDPSSNCLGEFVMCIAHTGDKLLASTDRNTVQSYTFPDMDNDGTLLRFTAPVTCLREYDALIAAGSEDTNIKVLRNGSNGAPAKEELQLEGHVGPILALDISSGKDLLASVGGDGHLKIWNIHTGEEVKSISGLARTNSFESAVCFGTPCFEPQQSKSLAYVKGKEVYVLNTSSWEIQYTLSDERVKGDYTCCQFSSDGLLLAAGTTAGEISVFDFVCRQPLRSEGPSSDCQAITCLAWNLANNMELAYCDATGQLGTLFSSGLPKGVGSAASLLDNDAEEVDYGDIEFDNDDTDDGRMSAAKERHLENVGVVDNDDDAVSIEKLKRKIMQAANGKLLSHTDEHSRDSMRSITSAATAPIKTFKQQVPFQPSATPDHLEHRYLVWNDVGIVSAHADSADGSIDVEFHDASVHHALHISNYNNHNMASLSTSVLALSGAGSSKLVCIALATAGNKEWAVQLPDCETAEALTATTKLVGVVTSMQFLRLFSVLGTQREVVSIPGPVLAVAGHEERLIVCYHSAPPSERQQHLAALLVQTKGLQLRVQHIPLPLPTGRQLSWLGFSDCGSPVLNDNFGLLQLYSLKSGCWYPISDTMKHTQSISNNYFVIAVSERSQIVQAVLCRGSSYPMTNPRPMLQELRMQLLLCDAESQKSELEDALMRATMLSVDGAEKQLKETSIKLFALACRSEMEARAKELIEMIACPELLQLAVKYATKLGRIHLSDRLSELMPQLSEQQEIQQQELCELEALHNLPLSPATHTRSSFSLLASTSNSKLLAPKAMELSHAKRAPLKRFSLSNHTISNSFKRAASGAKEPTATPTKAVDVDNTDAALDTQENVFADHAEKASQSSLLSKHTSGSSETTTRSPLNTVNPFASKRKLADVDFLVGAASLPNKLKIVKK